MELAGIFGWDIDFALDIRKNDTFRVLYQEEVVEGEVVGADQKRSSATMRKWRRLLGKT